MSLTHLLLPYFFNDVITNSTLTELAKEQKKVAAEATISSSSENAESTEVCQKEESASAFLEFIEKARTGVTIPAE